MDKIQKALEKARSEGTVARQAKSSSHGPAQTKSFGPTVIIYKDTKVVDVPLRKLERQRVVAGLANRELADTFRILRVQVMQRLTAKGHSTLAITSPNHGEGKSLISANLAISLAMHVTTTVLLVDLDLRRPSLSKLFGFRPQLGLREYILDDAPLPDCLFNPGIERLVILPAGAALHASSELLSSPKMIDLAKDLKSHYSDRLVVYDLPPLLATDDALTFLQYVDACVLIFQEGSTPKREIRQTMELLDGYNVIGTVLNKSSEANNMAYYNREYGTFLE